MNYPVKFTLYEHKLVIKDNQLITRHFICLKMSDNTRRFTNFHKYAKNPNKMLKKTNASNKNRCDFVVQLLNYAFFYRGIHSLNNISIDIIKDFLNNYGQCSLPDDDELTHRDEKTVLRCINVILDFMELYIRDNRRCKIKAKDLYTYQEYRDKKGKIRKRKVPVFDVYYSDYNKPIFRNMPNKVFEILFSHILTNHPQLIALISLSAFAGLRPSEACNVRRHDSALGPGVIFTTVDGEVEDVEIDLRKELALRSDLLPTGRIKKERMQAVPDIFLDAFVQAYNIYMEYMDGRKYEAEYGALTINKQGKAYTYASYYGKFQEITKKEIIPILLSDQDPEVVLYGRMLLERNISPHIFRHWYTVQLVLSGISEPGVLMTHRGDTSHESALTYIKNKSELEKQFRKVNDASYDFLSWLADKKYGK